MRETKNERKFSVTLGSRIKQHRLVRGWSRNILADLIGITHQQLQKYEAGTNRLSVSRLMTICRILNMRIEDFLQNIDGGIEKTKDLKTQDRFVLELFKSLATIKDEEHKRIILKLGQVLSKNNLN